MIKVSKVTVKPLLGVVLILATATLAPLPLVASPALLDAGATVDGVITDIRYAGENNFLGRPVTGYRAAKCWLTPEATSALSRAQRLAEAQGLAILIYDCYRPQRAVDDFVQWVSSDDSELTKAIYYPNVPRRELIERGYIAARSGHSRGSTVDISLIDAESGKRIDMGTSWDYFDERSHTQGSEVGEVATNNRLKLKIIMERAGFKGYYAEWWHFTLQKEPLPDTYLDVPIE